MSQIAVKASYSDFKILKTRSVFQIVLEAPIEDAESFVTAFGLPLPGRERPVALALLNSTMPPVAEDSGTAAADTSVRAGAGGAHPGSSNGRTSDFELDNGGSTPSPGTKTPPRREAPQRCPTAAPDRLVQYIAIACGDPAFQGWCASYFNAGIVDREGAAECVRQFCGIKSRAEISTNPAARQKARDLMADYDLAMGRAAEDRS